MAGKGPPKTSLKILQARGSWRAKERTGEPESAPLSSGPPDWLDARAIERWDVITKQLSNTGILGELDENFLSRYCQTWSRYHEMQAIINTEGSIATSAKGELKAHPAAILALRLGEQLIRMEIQLGMSPAARANMATAAKKPKADSDKDRFFA